MEIDEQIKQAAPEIKKLIDQSKRILLSCHPRADFDSVGSVLALGQVLLALGKEVTMISGDAPLPEFASVLPGHESILIQDIFQTDLTQFDLFISLDTTSLKRVSELGEVKIPAALQTIFIDHHPDDESFGQISLEIPEASSTGEILSQLFFAWEVPINADVALCLLVSIYGDTNSFKYISTTSRTFAIASELIKLAPDYYKVIYQIEASESFERVLFRAVGITKAERFFAGKLIISSIDAEDFKHCGIKLEEAANSGLSNALRFVAGCVAGVSLIEEVPGNIKLSSRSRDAEICDVSKLAALFDGGGHRVAAGALVKGKSLEEVKTEILDWFEKNC